MKANFTPIHDLVKKHREKASISKTKESEPVVPVKENYEIKEITEHKVEEEMKPFVQTRSDIIEIPPDLQKMGLQAVTTTQFPSWQTIKTPLSDDKIITGLHAPITSSLRWLAEFARYILFQAHLGLKSIHVKAIRILRT